MSIFDNPDEFFMQQALCEARLAAAEGEIPVGAVIVSDGRILARAHNNTEKLNDVDGGLDYAVTELLNVNRLVVNVLWTHTHLQGCRLR